MRLLFLGSLLLCTGCALSTHPMVDFLDHFFPGQISQEEAARTQRGGVCDPAPATPGAAAPARPPLAGVSGQPPAVPAGPPGPVVPGPAGIEPPPPEPPSFRPGP